MAQHLLERRRAARAGLGCAGRHARGRTPSGELRDLQRHARRRGATRPGSFAASREGLGNGLHRVSLRGEVVDVPGPLATRLRLHDLAADRRALVTIDAWRLRAMAGTHDCSLSDISYVSNLSADGTQGELGDVEAGGGAYLVPYDGGRRLRLGPGFPVAISPSG
jgi:hypothetical protein